MPSRTRHTVREGRRAYVAARLPASRTQVRHIPPHHTPLALLLPTHLHACTTSAIAPSLLTLQLPAYSAAVCSTSRCHRRTPAHALRRISSSPPHSPPAAIHLVPPAVSLLTAIPCLCLTYRERSIAPHAALYLSRASWRWRQRCILNDANGRGDGGDATRVSILSRHHLYHLSLRALSLLIPSR